MLDIGAGCFNIYRELNNTIKEQTNTLFVNVDLSGPFRSPTGGSLIKGARRIINKNIPTYAVECDINDEKIPFQEKSFNYIASCMALHHVIPEIREKVFRQIHKILKDDGVFINMDFYIPNKSRNVFTQMGERGLRNALDLE